MVQGLGNVMCGLGNKKKQVNAPFGWTVVLRGVCGIASKFDSERE
jgi:hypothetical protein